MFPLSVITGYLMSQLRKYCSCRFLFLAGGNAFFVHPLKTSVVWVVLVHRITEWLGLEGTSRIMKLQPPCRKQGHKPLCLILDQAAQGAIQPGLEHFQGWGIHSQPGQLFQHLTTLPPISMGFYFSILRGDTSSFLLSLRTFQNKATLSTHAHCSQEDCVT